MRHTSQEAALETTCFSQHVSLAMIPILPAGRSADLGGNVLHMKLKSSIGAKYLVPFGLRLALKNDYSDSLLNWLPQVRE